ncbi:MAG: hypothetical protein OXC91_02715 [Rhodobacteraceae bacterium]|nr:hypothetical protein [Paracoccaceae bacterium]
MTKLNPEEAIELKTLYYNHQAAEVALRERMGDFGFDKKHELLMAIHRLEDRLGQYLPISDGGGA